ncbi:Bug family tripartite tricarboxylate transporter substrate binding protein [Rhodoplanes sp. Z2-YC6860]|uniref:Bug family tripartite tricarboxylate transporter substrate binding protein n=1 Tax=Rhodoplanes sp. Z2-YC6860 TaxID=674703 RepID=UPI00078C9A06|nr:tripartite tricarboxylate transporter substrate binding protein [Rhodoplanes sp. Z2-YC6860]AMN44046.1 tricarboxylate binding receptor [Rhodoplanes sp. Z2-YC6860]
MRVLLLAFALMSTAAGAQDYPTRPITLIIPTAAGGGNDALGRVVADRMRHVLGQQLVVENRSGASGTIATKALARSLPDGYTIGVSNSGTMGMGPSLFPNAGYDPRKDFAPIGAIAASSMVLVVSTDVPARSLADLIELARKNPGKLTYGSSGAGSPSHLFAELFASMAGIKLTHVPFRGLGPAMNDLIGGHITMVFPAVSTAMGNIRAGSIRPLATTGETRHKDFPELPTIAEAGLAGYSAEQRYGMLAPAGTPAGIVLKLNAALREALSAPEVKTQIDNEGAVPQPGTPEDYGRDIDREEAKWSRVIRDTEATSSR